MLGSDDPAGPRCRGWTRCDTASWPRAWPAPSPASGGALYAHFTTYVEPQFFNVMLGVHALAYGLIGGLGTAFGPLIGVAIDIGFLEAVRFIQGYRMIVFGGLVAVLLIFMPRGILDEERVHRLRALFPKRSHARAAGN